MSIVQVVVSAADYAKLYTSSPLPPYRATCVVPTGARVLSGVEHRPDRHEVVLVTYEIEDSLPTISVETYRPIDWPEPAVRVIGTTRK